MYISIFMSKVKHLFYDFYSQMCYNAKNHSLNFLANWQSFSEMNEVWALSISSEELHT